MDGDAQNQIRQLVVEEFALALENSIKPMLQQQFQSVIGDVKQSLQTVNKEFSTRLGKEEEKNKALLEQYTQIMQAFDSNNIVNPVSANPNFYS